MDIGHDIMHCRYTASVNTYPGYIEMLDIQGESKKKWDLKKHGHNCSEIHHKGKKLVCSGKFSLNAAG